MIIIIAAENVQTPVDSGLTEILPTVLGIEGYDGLTQLTQILNFVSVGVFGLWVPMTVDSLRMVMSILLEIPYTVYCYSADNPGSYNTIVDPVFTSLSSSFQRLPSNALQQLYNEFKLVKTKQGTERNEKPEAPITKAVKRILNQTTRSDSLDDSDENDEEFNS